MFVANFDGREIPLRGWSLIALAELSERIRTSATTISFMANGFSSGGEQTCSYMLDFSVVYRPPSDKPRSKGTRENETKNCQVGNFQSLKCVCCRNLQLVWVPTMCYTTNGSRSHT